MAEWARGKITPGDAASKSEKKKTGKKGKREIYKVRSERDRVHAAVKNTR